MTELCASISGADALPLGTVVRLGKKLPRGEYFSSDRIAAVFGAGA